MTLKRHEGLNCMRVTLTQFKVTQRGIQNIRSPALKSGPQRVLRALALLLASFASPDKATNYAALATVGGGAS